MIRSIREVRPVDWVIAMVYMLLNVADAAITIHARHHVPGMYEVNPLMRWALQHGDLFFVCLKMGMAAAFSIFSVLFSFPRRVNLVLLIGSGMLALVVIWNIVLYAISTAAL